MAAWTVHGSVDHEEHMVSTVEASHGSIGLASIRISRLPVFPSGKPRTMCLLQRFLTKWCCLIHFSYRILHERSNMVDVDTLRAMTPCVQSRIKDCVIAVSNRPQSASSTSQILMFKSKALAVTSAVFTNLILDKALILEMVKESNDSNPKLYTKQTRG